jgi:molybdate transport repressor ModE-like protein
MHKVTIHPQWSIIGPDGTALAQRLVDLLVGVHEHGSLLAACQAANVSYRHAWQLIRQGDQLMGAPLLVKSRGKGSVLTPLGGKLVWADRRIRARLSPVLDSLASELEAEIEKVSSPSAPLLRIHANHGFAVEALRSRLLGARVPHEFRYCGSVEAVAALNNQVCELAGFAVPIGEFEPAVVEHYRPWLTARAYRLIHVAVRSQGLMVAPGNPKKIYEPRDLARPGVRFINRQPGSGTRLLLDLLLQQAKVAPARISGFEQCEYTHAAVAAFVASGMADAAYGVETPARQFKLDFIPSLRERYFLLCDERSLERDDVQELLSILRGPVFQAAVDGLPGYQAADAGRVLGLAEAFQSFSPALRGRVRAKG